MTVEATAAAERDHLIAHAKNMEWSLGVWLENFRIRENEQEIAHAKKGLHEFQRWAVAAARIAASAGKPFGV